MRAIRLLFLGVQPAEFITDAASVSVARLNIETLDTIMFMNMLYCLNGSSLRKPPFNKKLDSRPGCLPFSTALHIVSQSGAKAGLGGPPPPPPPPPLFRLTKSTPIL